MHAAEHDRFSASWLLGQRPVIKRRGRQPFHHRI